MRRVRKVISYACTECYALFPTSRDAKDHHASKHTGAAKRAEKRPKRVTQVGQIEEAIRAGATDAETISRRTKIDKERVHSLLSYLRRRRRISGFKNELRIGRRG